MKEAVNCLKCYRIHKYDNIIFCPFIGLEECIRGQHYVELENTSNINEIKDKSKIPDFKPTDKCASKKLFNGSNTTNKYSRCLKLGIPGIELLKK